MPHQHRRSELGPLGWSKQLPLLLLLHLRHPAEKAQRCSDHMAVTLNRRAMMMPGQLMALAALPSAGISLPSPCEGRMVPHLPERLLWEKGETLLPLVPPFGSCC